MEGKADLDCKEGIRAVSLRRVMSNGVFWIIWATAVMVGIIIIFPGGER